MARKTLMIVANQSMDELHAGPATGMNFHIVKTPSGFFAVFQTGEAMPLYSHDQYYCLDDFLAGVFVPKQRSTPQPIKIEHNYPNRFSALTALQAAKISPAFTGKAGASPLIATDKLSKNTKFHRYLSSGPDPRFSSGQLSFGTYLTSTIDAKHADSGFSAVGRYALPMPLPASHVIEYELLAGTTIEIGTVAPNFGQSGGGVEIHLPFNTSATQLSTNTLTDY